MNRSVNISSAIFIVLIISTFYSCKKEDENYTSSHVFWFDKDTKDSLVKHGYFCLTANYDYSPSNGDAGFGLTVDTGTFRWSLPGCDEKNLLYLKMKLKKGEKKTIPYRILRAEKTYQDLPAPVMFRETGMENSPCPEALAAKHNWFGKLVTNLAFEYAVSKIFSAEIIRKFRKILSR